MRCTDVDELDAAFALGALDAEEDRAVREHLATCREPHLALRAAVDSGLLLAASLAPLVPSPMLRDRLMATIASVPQDAAPEADAPQAPRVGEAPRATVPTSRRSEGGFFNLLRRPAWPRGLALAGVAAAVVLAVATGALWTQLGTRNAALDAVGQALASGETAHRVEGEAGRGFVIETAGGGSTLVLGEVAELPEDRLYELWLIDAGGVPLAVGTFTDDAGPVVVAVERDLTDFTTFAVTIEAARVDAPTGTPVMVGSLEG